MFFREFETLPFQNKHSESVATAFDDSTAVTAVVNHGNFLVAMKLIDELHPTRQAYLTLFVPGVRTMSALL